MKKRKFFSFMLMGLLTLGATSMVTSCKDYDDDINNLQDEQAQLTSQINTLQSSLESVRSSASSAASTAQEALTAAQSAAANANTAIQNAASAQAAATAAQSAADAVKASLANYVTNDALASELTKYATADALSQGLANLQTQVNNAATKEELAALKTQVDNYTAAINSLYTAVTSVSLVGSISAGGDNLFTSVSKDLTLNYFSSAIANRNSGKAYTFGEEEQSGASTKVLKGLADPVANFAYPGSAQTGTDLIIRVSPTNADLTPSMVKIINSKGEDLSKVLTVTSVEPYNELLTTRAGSKGGLWRVKTQVTSGITSANYSASNNAFQKAKVSNGKNILYAVAVNNTAADTTYTNAADRYVVSSYDIQLGSVSPLTAVNDLNYVKVYDQVAPEDGRTSQFIKDTKGSDYRTSNKPVAANNGDSIVVDFSATKDASDKALAATSNPTNVKYFYVVRDDDYAQGVNGSNNQASEFNAWLSYKYGGDLGYADVNHSFVQKAKMVEVNKGTGKAKFTIDLNGLQSGDEVGFRIFAVNFDGTLANTTGYSFRVYVADQSSSATFANSMKVTSATAANNTAFLAFSGSTLKGTVAALPGGSAAEDITLSAGDDDVTFTIEAGGYYKSDMTTKVTDAAIAAGTASLADIAYVKVSLKNSPTAWPDGSTVSAVIPTRDANGATVNSITYRVTKTFPTAAETRALYDLYWRQDQPNNPYVAFMQPTATGNALGTWTTDNATAQGYTDLYQAIGGLNGAVNTTTGANTVGAYVEKSRENSDPTKGYTENLAAAPTAATSSDSAKLVLNPDTVLFNPASETLNGHLTYTYVGISSNTATAANKAVEVTDGYTLNKNLVLTLYDFPIQYACPLAPEYTVVSHNAISYTTGRGTTADPTVTRNPYLVYSDGTIHDAGGENILKHVGVTFTNVAARSALGLSSATNVSLGDILAKYPTDNITVRVQDDLTNPNHQSYFTATYTAPTGTATVGTLAFTAKPTQQATTTTSYVFFECKDAFGHVNTYYFPITIKGAADAKRK